MLYNLNIFAYIFNKKYQLLFEIDTFFVLKSKLLKSSDRFPSGATGGTRTHTPVRITDFESVSSTNSDTVASKTIIAYLSYSIYISLILSFEINLLLYYFY